MSDISIRTATSSDLDIVVTLNQALIQADGGTRDPFVNLDWSAKHGHEYFNGLLQKRDFYCLIASDGEEPIGYLMGYLCQPNELRSVNLAAIHSMFVQADFRGTGVGSKLVERFKTWCTGQGIERVSVSAFASNERAIAFYQRHGFAPQNVTLESDLDGQNR